MDYTKQDNQIVSAERVADHGEVYTSKREVNSMLDLVKQETERIESRFLEPACGTGNFLAEILSRKLRIIERRYRRSQLECERYSVLAVSSIYGIDILEDNVHECRQRLYTIFDQMHSALFKLKAKDECGSSIKFILSRNIIWGNALNLMTVGENPQPIVFSEWSFIKGSMIKRRDFTYKALLSRPERQKDWSLFSDDMSEVFIPEPKKSFPIVHFLRVSDAE